MFAAQNGHQQVARALLEAGADVNATEEDDYTALMFACQNGHLEVACPTRTQHQPFPLARLEAQS